VVALAGVDLSIAPGETLVLVGPSGSGKSTLIALLAGLMRPSAGRINIGTYDMGKLSDAEVFRLRGTEIGVVLQGAARNLLPYATLHRNIWLAQRRAAHTRGITLDHPDRILDLVGLPGHGHARLADLTPGGQQRATLSVEQDPALLRGQQAGHRVQERGLAGAGGAGHEQHLPRPGRHGHVPQHRDTRVVRERGRLDHQRPARRRGHRAAHSQSRRLKYQYRPTADPMISTALSTKPHHFS
jgi:ABC-type uncharacterized transport system YnjBCD ATPase subunit